MISKFIKIGCGFCHPKGATLDSKRFDVRIRSLRVMSIFSYAFTIFSVIYKIFLKILPEMLKKELCINKAGRNSKGSFCYPAVSPSFGRSLEISLLVWFFIASRTATFTTVSYSVLVMSAVFSISSSVNFLGS